MLLVTSMLLYSICIEKQKGKLRKRLQQKSLCPSLHEEAYWSSHSGVLLVFLETVLYKFLQIVRLLRLVDIYPPFLICRCLVRARSVCVCVCNLTVYLHYCLKLFLQH